MRPLVRRSAFGRIVRCAAAALTLPLACAARAMAQAPPSPRASLVVLVAVDQLRPDYLDRWAAQLTGGLHRVATAGVLYRDGRQNHALTETAPGHSTMLSGRWPTHTNIWSNDAGVADSSARLLGGAGGPGASPTRFAGTTLLDWLRARDPATQVLSVSRKDRAAILPVGRARGAVFWFAEGRFTTSRYYADTLPGWLVAWNARCRLDDFAGRAWPLLRPERDYPEPDDAPWENGGRDRVFPHALPVAGPTLAAALERTPWMDSLTLDAALAGVAAMRLGRRPNGTDLLSVSLSSTDAIGHAYGPDSREIHDQVLRLDRMLGTFLDSLAALVPPERIALVLTADHGVISMPEYVTAHGAAAGRVDPTAVASEAEVMLAARWGVRFGLRFDNGLLTGDVAALRARGVDVDALADTLGRRLARLDGVRRVYTPRALRAAPDTDQAAGRWRRSLPASLGWLVAAVARPGWVFSDGTKAEHGTNQPETVRVPIAFLLPGLGARVVDRPIDTVDIAPTLAAWLGIVPSEPVDGRVLGEIVRGRCAGAAMPGGRC